ncbi:RHS repeat-associated core domain-containing protein [Ruminococcaceae bacterium OttesenSCG-928-A11]|nr:RHS repeat-associated core domain-containing protein [Ruminococcaceae bacterium OttesenSCG-928-A11]
MSSDNKNCYSNISYTYTPEGTRLSKTVNGLKTEYTLDGSLIMSQKTGNQVLNYYYDSAGKVVSIGYKSTLTAAEVFYFVSRNNQGDIIALYNSSNSTLVGTYSYDAWGRILATTKASASSDPNDILTKNPFRYRGYYYDTETSWYYLQSRYYDPAVRRFINADTTDILGEPGEEAVAGIDLNLFAYCDNNPVNRTDEGGYFWEELAWGGLLLAAIGGIALLTLTTGGVGTALLAAGASAQLVTAATIFSEAAILTGMISTFTGTTGMLTEDILNYAKKQNPDPFARPGQKKQGLENKSKARKKDDWVSRSGKRRPTEPKSHTPGRDHRKDKYK